MAGTDTFKLDWGFTLKNSTFFDYTIDAVTYSRDYTLIFAHASKTGENSLLITALAKDGTQEKVA